MVLVSDILDFLETVAPSSLKMEWDNVGLLCGDRQQSVKKVLVALDPFMDTCEEAVEVGADLILTHHPLIFRPAREITRQSPTGREICFLIRHGISAVNAHTNLDLAPGGVNDVLAETLGLSDIQSISTPDGALLRCGYVEEMPLSAFLSGVKDRLSCPGLRYADGGKPVHFVAVGGGACGDELDYAVARGCDTFVTADVKYNQFREAYDQQVSLIDAGHFYTENPVCAVLARKLQCAFPEISVVLSQKSRDVMNFFTETVDFSRSCMIK